MERVNTLKSKCPYCGCNKAFKKRGAFQCTKCKKFYGGKEKVTSSKKRWPFFSKKQLI